jgi:hypothetical protein
MTAIRMRKEDPGEPPARPRPDRDPEEEGSAAKPRQTPAPRDNDPEEEGSAARPER